MKIILDNGHGSNTNGKHSPDKSVMEWKVTREIVEMLHRELVHNGYDAVKLVPETIDISLSERVRRVNQICKEKGSKNTLVVSVHLNAAGADGKWHSATGFSAHVGNNASSNSKKLAKLLWEEAVKQGLNGNRCVPPEGYIAQNLAICRDTNCPAVLTENLFMDNKEDCAKLQTLGGKIQIVRALMDGILRYVEDV